MITMTAQCAQRASISRRHVEVPAARIGNPGFVVRPRGGNSAWTRLASFDAKPAAPDSVAHQGLLL